jgi:hypothetical protein
LRQFVLGHLAPLRVNTVLMSRASTSRAMPPPPITARRTTAHVLDDAQREAISGIDSGSAIDYASLFRVPEEASRASRPAVKAATAPAPSRAAPDTPPRPSVTEMLDAVRTTPGKRVGSALAGLDPSMLAAIQNMAAREKAAQDDEEEQEEQEEAKRAPRAGAKKAPSAARKSLGAPKAIQDEVAPAPARRKPTAATAAPARRVTRSRARAEEPEPTVLAGDEEEEEEEEQATSAPVRSRQSFGASAAVAASAARVRTRVTSPSHLCLISLPSTLTETPSGLCRACRVRPRRRPRLPRAAAAAARAGVGTTSSPPRTQMRPCRPSKSGSCALRTS